MKRLVLELDEELHQKIKVKTTKEKKSMREVMTSLLMAWLKKG